MKLKKSLLISCKEKISYRNCLIFAIKFSKLAYCKIIIVFRNGNVVSGIRSYINNDVDAAYKHFAIQTYASFSERIIRRIEVVMLPSFAPEVTEYIEALKKKSKK